MTQIFNANLTGGFYLKLITLYDYLTTYVRPLFGRTPHLTIHE